MNQDVQRQVDVLGYLRLREFDAHQPLLIDLPDFHQTDHVVEVDYVNFFDVTKLHFPLGLQVFHHPRPGPRAGDVHQSPVATEENGLLA